LALAAPTLGVSSQQGGHSSTNLENMVIHEVDETELDIQEEVHGNGGIHLQNMHNGNTLRVPGEDEVRAPLLDSKKKEDTNL
jgi:hypothetical protein